MDKKTYIILYVTRGNIKYEKENKINEVKKKKKGPACHDAFEIKFFI